MFGMGIGRATLACVIMGLSVCSVAACALLVGPVEGEALLETADSSPQSDEVAAVEASPTDAPSEDEEASVADTSWTADSEGATPDAAPGDVWSDAGPCQISSNDLITNGDFSMGVDYWAIVYGPGYIVTPDGGPLCVETTGGQYAILAWTKGVALPPDSYDFWYCAWASQQSVTINPVVGHSLPPNTQDYGEGVADTVTTGGGKQDHQFALDGGDWDDSGGLSFQISSQIDQQVCFQSVNLSVLN